MLHKKICRACGVENSTCILTGSSSLQICNIGVKSYPTLEGVCVFIVLFVVGVFARCFLAVGRRFGGGGFMLFVEVNDV